MHQSHEQDQKIIRGVPRREISNGSAFDFSPKNLLKFFYGAWPSGLRRRAGGPKIAGSNPVAPTCYAVALCEGEQNKMPC
jgi:hypothetical protein